MNQSRRNFIRTVLASSVGLRSLSLLSSEHSFFSDKLSQLNNTDPSLFSLFQNPANQAKPYIRWWWNGNLIEKKEISRQLDVLKNAGIGGVEINSIRFPGQDKMGIKELEWLSDEWIDMVKYTVKEAHKREMVCDIIVGSGWPFGGEFLEKEEQTQVLTMNVNSYKLVGPATVQFSKEELLNRVNITDNGTKELYTVRMVPSYMDKFEEGVDLTDQFDEDGILHIKVPYYVDQDLIVIVKTTGVQSVTLGAPGASGPVLNHFNKKAVDRYLNRMSDALEAQVGSLGDSFRSMFCDSLELTGNTWCDDMLEEFERRRGYSLKPYIPFVFSADGWSGNPVKTRIVDSALEEVNRVRYDYVITKQELFEERFTRSYHEWCQRNGVKSRLQAYGVVYHPIEASMILDIPECETWLGDHNGLKDHHGFTSANKFVASGSRLANKKLVSCEEITNISQVFFASLEMIKIIGDQSNLSGVNHSVLHGYNYSPERAEFPGWVRWGAYFNERNPWWPYFKQWTSYKARISSLFQLADPRADIAIMHPLGDKWSKYGQQFQPAFGWGERYPWYEYDLWYAIHQNGNTCDYVSENIVNDAQIENGVLKYNERSYHTIMLMEVTSIDPKTALSLAKFAQSGGKIIFIGEAPTKSIGLLNYQKNDLKVKEEVGKITAKYTETCKIVQKPAKNLMTWFQQIQDEFNITPPVKINHPSLDVSQVQYTFEDKEIYFFVNSSRTEKHSFDAEFNTGDKQPWIWNAETGERFLYPYVGQKNKLNIELLPAESKLIVFENGKDGKLLPEKLVDRSSAYILAENWEAEFNHIDGTKKKKTFKNLEDLKNNPEFKEFGGTVTYTTKLKLKPDNLFSYIDLGEVYGVSEVSINGVSLGSKWYGEHLYDCKELLRDGKVTIKATITTVAGNYCKSLTENETCQKWTKNQSYESMGLIGPVKLLSGV